jgi:hypothetical protein
VSGKRCLAQAEMFLVIGHQRQFVVKAVKLHGVKSQKGVFMSFGPRLNKSLFSGSKTFKITINSIFSKESQDGAQI